MEASPWVEKRGEMLGRVLDIVSQWPGATLDMAASLLRRVPRASQRRIPARRSTISVLWTASGMVESTVI